MMPFATMNQMSLGMPQGNEGLGVPWGRAMFNLPHYQTPGSTLNFGGNFGAPQTQSLSPTGVDFSITRTASSDPVKNVIGDMQNPLGGMNVNFQPAAPQQANPSALKGAMLSAPAQDYAPMDNGALSGLGFPGYSPLSEIGFPNQRSPFALKSRMMGGAIFA